MIRRNWLLLVILAVGLFFRIYKPLELYMYGHDQDLAGWIVKDILANKHLRLIGQETSFQGVFIGPLFYYLQIPFYLLTRMDSSGTIILVTLLGLFSIFSFWLCFSKMFGKKVGLISAFIYAIGVYFIFTDREVVPTMPVHLWSVWFLFGLWLILKGWQKAYILLGILLGIAWNFNLALVILAPLILIAWIISKKRIDTRYMILGVATFLITFSPFIIFELRHSFRQTKAIVASLTTNKDYISGTSRGLAKLDRVFQLVRKNTSTIVWGRNSQAGYVWTIYLLVFAFLYVVKKRLIAGNLAVVMAVWLLTYLVFFTINPVNLSEYYLNGMNVVWVTVMAVFISDFLFRKYLGFVFLAVIAGSNFVSFWLRPINRSGYLERKALVEFINQDSKNHNYPRVSVSYITSPGNNLGYRYFFWLKKMHVNKPDSGSPVYTIVFPHSLVNRIDKSFGALGLILPEYQKYTESRVKQSCSGENLNLVDAMFGYTE